jgi:hypothetical protein
MLAAEWTFGSVLWTMVIFFFWTMAIWVFITLFGDILRRNDISGWAKAGWVLLLFVLPLVGALIYIGSRPRMAARDDEVIASAEAAQRRA